MGKVSDNEMIMFAAEFARTVAEVDEDLLYDVALLFGESRKSYFSLESILYAPASESANLVYKVASSIDEYTEDKECVGILFCEGFLYEMLYSYSGHGYGGEDAKKLHDALYDLSARHGMWFEWGDGRINMQVCDN